MKAETAGLLFAVATAVGGVALHLPGAAAQEQAEATEPRFSPQYERCVEGAASNAEEGTCLAEELTREKAKLNAAYSIALADARAESKVDFERGQRAWVTYRDATCAAKTVRGSGAAVSHYSCMIAITEARRAELADFWAF